MINLLLFFSKIIKSAFVFIPALSCLSCFRRKMFRPSPATMFFSIAAAVAFIWRMFYTMINTHDFVATRYMAPLSVFLIIIAVPGLYAFVDFVSSLLSLRFKSVKKTHIWFISLALITSISIGKEIRPEKAKTFLKDSGRAMESWMREKNGKDFILVENLGEANRLAYYSPYLSGKIISTDKDSYIGCLGQTVSLLKSKKIRHNELLVLTRHKDPEVFLANWNRDIQQKIKNTNSRFIIVQKYYFKSMCYFIIACETVTEDSQNNPED